MGWFYVLACTTCKVQIDLAKSGRDGCESDNLGSFVTKHTSCTKRVGGKDYFHNLIVCNEQQDEGSEYPEDKEFDPPPLTPEQKKANYAKDMENLERNLKANQEYFFKKELDKNRVK